LQSKAATGTIYHFTKKNSPDSEVFYIFYPYVCGWLTATLELSHVQEDLKPINYNGITKSVKKLKNFDWSAEGRHKYIKGFSGSKILSFDLVVQMV
jgi:hypothetical protein